MLEMVMFGSIVSAPFIAMGGLTVRKSVLRKQKKEQERLEYKWHFPEAYWNQSGIYPVSYILLQVANEVADFQPWMGEVKRYEGNRIESEEIQEQFWLNLVLLNEKYERFTKDLKYFDDWEAHKSYEYNYSYLQQLRALKTEVLERCQECFDMMKADSVAEREERLSIGATAPIERLEAPKEPFMASEEKALLHILESPKASAEMKIEAGKLLEKWKSLHMNESLPSAEENSMRIDLLTIRNIIEGKEVQIQESPVLSVNSKQ